MMKAGDIKDNIGLGISVGKVNRGIGMRKNNRVFSGMDGSLVIQEYK